MTTQILIFLDTSSQTTFNHSVQLIQLTTGLINFSVSGVIIGDMEPSHQKMALTHGFTKIIQIQTPDNTIADINISPSLILDWLKPVIPDLFIFPDSDYGRLLGASIAAQLDLPFYPSINTLQKMDEGFILTRQTFGNKVKQTIYQNNVPFFLSAKISSSSTAALFPSAEEIAVIKHTPVSIPENPIHILQNFQHSATIPVEQARIIITGGRGLLDNPSNPPDELSGEAVAKWKVKSGFDLLQTLAQQLNGTVAATRALVDSGYAPYEWQIGQTGKFVSPELYIACGVSGAIQHTIGMNNSRTIIAINKDPDAPIFKIANYGIVGDLYEIIPQLINRLG